MILPDFSQARILIVGDIMLDRYWKGGTSRISPEAPVPVVNIKEIEDRPGGAANVAINAASLGASVTLLGLCGEDENAQLLQARLESYGVQCSFLPVSGFDTITKLRVLSRNQQLLRMDFEKSFSQVDKSQLVEQFSQQLEDVDLVVFSDYNKGALSDVRTLIKLAKQQNLPIVVDPKGNNFAKYRGATVLTPNMAELEGIVGEVENESELLEKATGLKNDLDLTNLLVTRSEKGMSLYSAEAPFHLPAKAREVYDVTGAGDTVVSTLSVAMACGQSVQQSCVLANIAASIVVGKLGTSVITPTELALALNEQGTHLDGGVMNEDQLLRAIEQAKGQGERVVMTNGCFDILHAGHVSYLQAAAQLGDRLIVAVNTDESVTQLKGPGRPVNSVDRRMAVLAGLSAVDWVVPFPEDTPRRLIARLLPDVLVKGGDYTVEEIAGAEEVQENGGEVKVLHFEEGVSTTGIIEQIVSKRVKLE
ncbi:bifunctional D-glycero-beta-D-manno-heptose-7-phosphate kinase/D-glycero-beta-D-manno-heptose 1-phosphate adenylyltransferase HldE [Alteromonas sp. ASW11-130]|uniref:bifunctional D-glycero-beta-D-manno-heptose-7-phosphate kinase/D-glycero-beta-D-manno-heptose 1-phosphate adenylyltransferase HldE n=1 Tax=Alteromonas sp. ASW11-130 TaxID=3015775 RepID=UPI002242872A|nr:bifunctional D-glycero-beta-D-manno-heptose-7-phosphate kinase/D-glycero-beta-D-manno-heptose 1-phosphate adenylyltransferase HldE [Alteromonas sp. ASW11-130]MCW8091260.1 bifunctional D-glycero-beta-D-manno-heptose-7-phosphate kinase/D-glycero-beta-D-manno-heptose 1-phosphate adenylyltransferase HldE [Alteromonas sp. ASW11-130]